MVSVSVSAQLCWIPLVTGNSYFLNRPGHEEACFRERALSPLAAKRSHNLPDILTTDYMFISELQVHVLLLEFFFFSGAIWQSKAWRWYPNFFWSHANSPADASAQVALGEFTKILANIFAVISIVTDLAIFFPIV